MTILTVWANDAGSVKLHQLSDDAADGTAAEQIAFLATLDGFSGYSCVCDDYTGTCPDASAHLWRWDGSAVTALPAPPSQPTVEKVAEVLLEIGMTQEQLNNLFAKAAAL